MTSNKSKKIVFNDEDYNSPDGMMTSIWGPPMWHILHTISFNYPVEPTKEHKVNYYNFYSNLVNILPCKYCRDNLCNNFKKFPLNKSVFKNRDSLSRYIYELHETINKMLGKKSNLTYEMVRDRYEHFRSRCLNENEIKIKKTNKETGCTQSLYGVKGKCVLNIVPKTTNMKSFIMDRKCKIRRRRKLIN
jgi:hypothetical protein